MNEQGKPASPAPPAAEHEEQQEPHVSHAPEYKAHYGRVQAAVWRRDIEGRSSYSVTLTRSYKDKTTSGRGRATSTKTTSCRQLRRWTTPTRGFSASVTRPGTARSKS